MAIRAEEVDKTQTTQSLSIIDNVDLQHISATMQKIAGFQAVVQKTLKKDHDYGIIPGTGNKPTLLKPGAEKILMLMGLTSEYEVVEKVQDYEKGFFAFTVKCRLSKGNLLVTEGLGHANTKEARYSNRWVTERKLPDGIDKDALQSREREGKYGPYKEYLVENLDTFTLVNTVLKMAKKRAQVDAALTVASLSEIFSQDLEDLAMDDPQETPVKQGKAPKAQPNKKGSTVRNPQGLVFAQVAKWAEETGFSVEEALETAREILRTSYGVESCSALTPAQWAAIANKVDRLISAVADQFIKEAEEVAEEETFDEAPAQD